jgi:hypothetical protein
MRGALPQPLALETEHSDAMPIVDDIATNMTVSSNATETEQTRAILWNEGRRIVELELIAEQLYCNSCHAPLHLKDIFGELRLTERRLNTLHVNNPLPPTTCIKVYSST